MEYYRNGIDQDAWASRPNKHEESRPDRSPDLMKGVLNIANYLGTAGRGYPNINDFDVQVDPQHGPKAAYQWLGNQPGSLVVRGPDYNSSAELLLKTLLEYTSKMGKPAPPFTTRGFTMLNDEIPGPQLPWKDTLEWLQAKDKTRGRARAGKRTEVAPYSYAELRPNPVDTIETFRARGIPDYVLEGFAKEYLPYVRGAR